jgi:hypothetical protein
LDFLRPNRQVALNTIRDHSATSQDTLSNLNHGHRSGLDFFSRWRKPFRAHFNIQGDADKNQRIIGNRGLIAAMGSDAAAEFAFAMIRYSHGESMPSRMKTNLFFKNATSGKYSKYFVFVYR